MTSYVIGTLYLAFVILAVASLFLPRRLMWRTATLSAIALVGGRVIEGEPHWSQQGVAHALGTAIVAIFILVVVLLLGLRLALAATVFRRQDQATLPLSVTRAFDQIIVGTAGGVIALLFVSFLGGLLSGSSGGWQLDLGIAFAAWSAAVACLLYARGRTRAAAAAFFAVVLAVALVGTAQQWLILNDGEAIARGRPWCLVGPASATPISSTKQLGFFSLFKGGTEPHLALHVREGNVWLGWHWSIKQQRFIEGLSGNVGTCYPRPDYAEAVRNGTVDLTVFAVGDRTYRALPELRPIARPDHLSIRNSDVSGPIASNPDIFERVSISFETNGSRRRANAEPIPQVPLDHHEVDAMKQTGKSRVFTADDLAAGRSAIVECLRGASADENCSVDVQAGLVTYRFSLPVENLTRWADAADQVEAVFHDLESH